MGVLWLVAGDQDVLLIFKANDYQDYHLAEETLDTQPSLLLF